MTEEALPKIDFATFIISMSHSALIQLGEAPHPETQALEPNLPLARQTIDLLGLLEEKTRGNLSGDEERLLTVGQSSTGRLLVVCHIEQGDTIRIVSARRATAYERQDYET